MATTGKRQVLDGRPSIPAATDLQATRAAVDQIRTRLEKLDAAVNRAFHTLDGSSPQKALESLQRQIAVLSKDLENLTAQVESSTSARQPTYLAMQMGDDGEDGMVGPPGPAGPQGERGHTLLLDQDDYNEHFVMGPPGERGSAGPPGSTVVLDFSECCGDDFPVGFPPSEAAAGSGAASLTATQVGFGSGANVLTGSANMTWDDTNRRLTLGVGTGPSRIFSANAVSGAGASSLTIQTGDANPGVVGAGLLSLQGGAGGGSSAAGNIEINGGSTTGSSTGGSIAISGGTSSSGTAGNVTIATGGVTRITVAPTGGVTISSALTLSSTLSGTSATFSSTLSATSGTFSSTLQSTSLRVTGTTAPDNGMYLQAANVVGLAGNSVAAYLYGSTAFGPQTNNARDCGQAAVAWRDIFTVNAPTVTSDGRSKTDLQPTELGLNFVLGLQPVSYRQRVASTEVRDNKGKLRVPERAGIRRHHGFVAQQVRQLLDEVGIGPAGFAGWCLADPSDPDSSQALRYEQLIAPLVKAVQELTAEVRGSRSSKS